MKASLVYLMMLALAGIIIGGTLELGSTLPNPSGAAPVSQGTSPTGASSWTEGLRDAIDNPLSHLLVQLLIIIAVSRAMGRAFAALRQPMVIGEMAAGIVLGPSLFGLVTPDAFAFVFPEASLDTLRLLSQIGVCLFMFAVGMDVDIRQVRKRARTAVAVSHASIVLPYTLGVVLAWGLYRRLAAPGATFTAFALFMGISMSITAFPVLARILRERGLTGTPLGATAITCAAVDDVTAWSILAFVVAIATANNLAGSIMSLLLIVSFVAIMILGVRPLLRTWLQTEPSRGDLSSGTLATVVCVVVAAALGTELIGIHALFGAFLAGAIMPEEHYFRQRVGVRVEAFSSVLLLPLFFAYTGLRTQVGLLASVQDWLLCLVIIVVASAGKLGGSAIAARLTGMPWAEALQLGALMNTRGLMELIVLNLGYDLGILSPRIFTMLVIMALVTTTMTGPLLTLFGRGQVAVGVPDEASPARGGAAD